MEKLTSLLAEVSVAGDDEVVVGKRPEPFPEDHWINRSFQNESELRTLLHLSLEKSNEDRAEKFGRVLLSAGARADLYNEDLGVAPIHVAAKQVCQL